MVVSDIPEVTPEIAEFQSRKGANNWTCSISSRRVIEDESNNFLAGLRAVEAETAASVAQNTISAR